jgi:hypothetical protein
MGNIEKSPFVSQFKGSDVFNDTRCPALTILQSVFFRRWYDPVLPVLFQICILPHCGDVDDDDLFMLNWVVMI